MLKIANLAEYAKLINAGECRLTASLLPTEDLLEIRICPPIGLHSEVPYALLTLTQAEMEAGFYKEPKSDT